MVGYQIGQMTPLMSSTHILVLQVQALTFYVVYEIWLLLMVSLRTLAFGVPRGEAH